MTFAERDQKDRNMTSEGASANPNGTRAEAPSSCANAPLPRAAISVIQKRRDFLAAAKARRWNAKGMVVQARERDAEETSPTPVRVGYTCSKKVGNAVARNRAKRRLRAAAAQVLPANARPGWDYVLIGRAEATAARPFEDLAADLEGALAALHTGKGEPGGGPRRKRGKGKA